MSDASEHALERFAAAAQRPTALLLLLAAGWAGWVILNAPADVVQGVIYKILFCLLYTSPSPRD